MCRTSPRGGEMPSERSASAVLAPPYSTILYYTILYYTTLYHNITPHHITSHHIT